MRLTSATAERALVIMPGSLWGQLDNERAPSARRFVVLRGGGKSKHKGTRPLTSAPHCSPPPSVAEARWWGAQH
jgi:hypothetical protein